MRLRWILISYFLIGGGVAIALGILGLAWLSAGTLNPEMIAKLAEVGERGLEELPSISGVELAVILTYATGSAFGALFTARATPHKSYIEPAIAAALVVGSFLLAVYLSPMGKILLNLTGGHLERLASILAATGIVSGLLGATLGELATIGTRRPGFVQRTGLSLIITAGALWTSSVIFGVVYANEVAEQALANLGNPDTRKIVELSVVRVATFAAIASAAAAAAAGVAAQLGAEGRVVGPAALAAVLVFATAAIAIGVTLKFSEVTMILVALAAGGAAAALAASSAYLVWLARGRPFSAR